MLSGVLGPSLDVFKDRAGVGDSAVANLFTAWAIDYMTGGALSRRLYDPGAGNPLLAAGLVGSAMVMALTAHAG